MEHQSDDGPNLGPLLTDSCKIWCVGVLHLKYGHETAEIQNDDVTFRYSIIVNLLHSGYLKIIQMHKVSSIGNHSLRDL